MDDQNEWATYLKSWLSIGNGNVIDPQLQLATVANQSHEAEVSLEREQIWEALMQMKEQDTDEIPAVELKLRNLTEWNNTLELGNSNLCPNLKTNYKLEFKN